MKLTGDGLDILQVGRGAILKNDGASTLAVLELESEWLALSNCEDAVEELGLVGSSGQGGESRENEGVLHFERCEFR